MSSWRIALLLLVWSAAAWGRPVRKGEPTPAAVQALRSAGLRELSRGHHAEAARALSAAYRLLPDARGLFLLFTQAWAEGRTQAAKDLARRYLAEAAAQPSLADDGSRREAQRVLSLPDEPAGELTILGAAGAFVLLDDRLVGRLPLARPLWVAAGPHQIDLEFAKGRRSIPVQAPARSAFELRVEDVQSAAVLTRLSSMVILAATLPPELAAPLGKAVIGAAQREHVALPPASTVPAEQVPGDCFDSLDCLDGVAKQSEATYVLAARPFGARGEGAVPGQRTLELRLFAGGVGELVATRTLDCAAGSPPPLAERFEQAIADALALAGTRPRGELVLDSVPAGAVVMSDGRQLGTTPYRRAAWAGRKRLELRLDGYLPWAEEVEIDEGRPTSLSIKLQLARPAARPEPLATAPLPRRAAPTGPAQDAAPTARRPLWRLVTGGLVAAVGLTLVGLGGSALAIDGRCSADTPATALACRQAYDATAQGGALVGVGVGVTALGVVLAALPAKPRPPAFGPSLR